MIIQQQNQTTVTPKKILTITENEDLRASSIPTDQFLQTMKSLHDHKGLTRSSGFFATGPIGGLVKMERKPVLEGGLQLGNRGFVEMSNGKILEVPIRRDSMMVASVPQLSGREWRYIDAEIATERYFNPVN
jgi:hypothetical protein